MCASLRRAHYRHRSLSIRNIAYPTICLRTFYDRTQNVGTAEPQLVRSGGALRGHLVQRFKPVLPGAGAPRAMRDKAVGRVLGLHPLLLVQLCFCLFIDCASGHGFIRNTETLPLKATEGLEITDASQLPRQLPQVIIEEERGPQGLGADLTKAI